MEVAKNLLVQHHSADADLLKQSEEEEDSDQGVKPHVTVAPYLGPQEG